MAHWRAAYRNMYTSDIEYNLTDRLRSRAVFRRTVYVFYDTKCVLHLFYFMMFQKSLLLRLFPRLINIRLWNINYVLWCFALYFSLRNFYINWILLNIFLFIINKIRRVFYHKIRCSEKTLKFLLVYFFPLHSNTCSLFIKIVQI